MLVENREISELIIKIGRHYTDNIATRFLRPLFAEIFTDTDLARRVADLTEYSDAFVLRGIHLDDLYRDIIALARFSFIVKRDIMPNIRALAEVNTRSASSSDRIYRNMAFNNLGANIDSLREDLKDLYDKSLEYDKAHVGKGRLVARMIPSLAEVPRLLGVY